MQHRFNMNAEDNSNPVALVTAIERRDHVGLENILKASTKHLYYTKDHQTLLDLAIDYKNYVAAELLLKYEAKEIENSPDGTRFLRKKFAKYIGRIEAKSPEFADLLERFRADEDKFHYREVLLLNSVLTLVHMQNDSDQTSLHRALNYRDARMCKLLLEHGARANKRDAMGNRPLHSAAQQDDPELAALLIAAGADPNARNSAGFAALDYAVKQSRTAVAKVLLENGAKVHARGPNLLAPFQALLRHPEVLRKDCELVALLLQHGASVDARDQNSSSLLDIVIAGYKTITRLDLVHLLASKGASLEAPFHTACVQGFVPYVLALLYHGTRKKIGMISELTHTYQTPLHLTIRLKRRDLFKVLLYYGADVNRLDMFGKAPIEYVRRFDECYDDVVEYLLEFKADFRGLKTSEEKRNGVVSRYLVKRRIADLPIDERFLGVVIDESSKEILELVEKCSSEIDRMKGTTLFVHWKNPITHYDILRGDKRKIMPHVDTSELERCFLARFNRQLASSYPSSVNSYQMYKVMLKKSLNDLWFAALEQVARCNLIEMCSEFQCLPDHVVDNIVRRLDTRTIVTWANMNKADTSGDVRKEIELAYETYINFILA